jgi:hypothetical protein
MSVLPRMKNWKEDFEVPILHNHTSWCLWSRKTWWTNCFWRFLAMA